MRENAFLPLMKGEIKRGLGSLQPPLTPSFIRRGNCALKQFSYENGGHGIFNIRSMRTILFFLALLLFASPIGATEFGIGTELESDELADEAAKLGVKWVRL